MNPLQLREARDVGALFRQSLQVFVAHAWLFILLSAAVVLPVWALLAVLLPLITL